jgi:hypothetical protein
MTHRFGDFIRRHRSVILFVIIVGVGFGGFRRQEANDAATRALVVQNKELTLQIAAQNDAQLKALCDSRVAANTELQVLLLGMVDDFIPVGRPARYELERRINEALGPPPEDCR